LAGEFIDLQPLDDRYVQVFYANVMLGFIDAQRAEYGLVRPKVRGRKQQTMKLGARRSEPKATRSKGNRPAQRTKGNRRGSPDLEREARTRDGSKIICPKTGQPA